VNEPFEVVLFEFPFKLLSLKEPWSVLEASKKEGAKGS